jgi:predicted ABC-type ATPase
MIVAGANGSGKSTLTKLFTDNIPVIDPDAIAREMSACHFLKRKIIFSG